MVFHTFRYFNSGGEITFYGDEERLINILDQWPQNKPLPLILYRSFTSLPKPTFRWGLIKRKRKGSLGGCCVFLVFIETDLTRDLIVQPPLEKPRYTVWALEDTDNIGKVFEKFNVPLKGHLGIVVRALAFSDRLTRWLRGDVGWTAGPKPDVNLYDFMVGFEPRWRRKPLTPEMLVKT